MRRAGYLALGVVATALCVALLLVFSPRDMLAEEAGFWLMAIVWPAGLLLLVGIIVWQVRLLRRLRSRLEHRREPGDEF